MSKNTSFDAEHPKADPTRARPQNAFDANDGYSGQEYSEERERDQTAKAPPGKVNPPASIAVEREKDGRDIPRDTGQRASFDPRTGAVHGSGSGAGGGNDGEDYDARGKGGS